MVRLLPTLVAFLTLLSMFCGNDPFFKTLTVVLCVFTSISYFVIHNRKLYGTENPWFTLGCGWIWAFNAVVQGFLLANIISKM